MSDSTTSNLAILFADICDSTPLYDTIGDTEARHVIASCFHDLEGIVTRNHGRLVKSIGDEILCTFEDVGDAAEAAIAFQELLSDGFPTEDEEESLPIALKVGFQFGPAIEEMNDVFGDAVNVAARMVHFAKGGQIITTRQTADLLPVALRDITRHLDTAPVKGKNQDIEIYEVVWQEDESTQMWSGLFNTELIRTQLRIRYRDIERILGFDAPPFILGRGRKADLCVHEDMVSREHAMIETKRGKFVLVDTSTNGTYASVQDKTVWLRREEVALDGAGTISLGRKIGDDPLVLIHYACEQIVEGGDGSGTTEIS